MTHGSRAESKNCEILLLPTADRRFDSTVKCPTGRASFWVKFPTVRSLTRVKCPGIARGGGMGGFGIDWYITFTLHSGNFKMQQLPVISNLFEETSAREIKLLSVFKMSSVLTKTKSRRFRFSRFAPFFWRNIVDGRPKAGFWYSVDVTLFYLEKFFLFAESFGKVRKKSFRFLFKLCQKVLSYPTYFKGIFWNNYHRFRWYATLENKTPAETFLKFPLVLRVIDRSDRNSPITARYHDVKKVRRSRY